jgi:hypothetical protein
VYVARMGYEKCVTIMVGRGDWKYHLEDQDVDGRMILKSTIKKQDDDYRPFNRHKSVTDVSARLQVQFFNFRLV